MIRIENKALCTGCRACAEVCPRSCITMEVDKEGFLYPHVEEKACVDCDRCVQICPVLAQQGKRMEKPGHEEAYAAYTNHPAIQLTSSSGGLFTEFATYVIQQGGVVFGVALDEACHAVHCYAETEEELVQFRGSKYMQSVIGTAYRDAKTFLNAGRWVLFSGTPCQIAGLMSYLDRPYERLITQDLICHGVPSSAVWDSYVASKKKGKLTHVTFRDKTYGWSAFSIVCHYSDGTKDSARSLDDPYMQVFLKNYCLRPSCYACAYKGKHHTSDLTLADFWGIDQVAPDMNHGAGTSLVLIHTDKGRALYREILQRITAKEVDYDVSTRLNPVMYEPAYRPAKRDAFMETVISEGFAKAYRRYARPSFPIRLKRKIRRRLGLIKRRILKQK